MIATDEDALICDFAEVYHILNYRGLPLSLAATLCCGLGPNSRCAKARNKMNVSLDTLLAAQMVDALNVLVWQNTKDGQKGVNHPKSVARILMGEEDEHENESYTSGEEFLAARQRIIEEIENGNRIS